jgi:tetratricopeptide (TPR) repeat protein
LSPQPPTSSAEAPIVPPEPALPTPGTIEALKAEELAVATRLTEEFPASADAICLLGEVHLAHGHTAEAMLCWQKSLELNPNLAHAYSSMAWVALRRGESEEAVRLFSQALQIAPRSSSIRSPLAGEMLKLGTTHQAVTVLEEQIRRFPGECEGYYLLGKAHEQLGDFAEARNHYRQAVAIRPGYAQAHYGLATACVRLGQRDKAKEHMAAFKRLKNQDGKAVSDRLKAYDDSATTRESLARTHTLAGKIYQRERNARKAEEHWRRAAAMDPKNAESRRALTTLLRAAGRQREALRVCEQLREIDPQDAVLYLNIGVLNAELNQFDAALSAVERAIELKPDETRFRQVYEQIKQSQ